MDVLTDHPVEHLARTVATDAHTGQVRPRLSRTETLAELARMESEGDAFYAAHPEIDPDEPHAVRVSAAPAPEEGK